MLERHGVLTGATVEQALTCCAQSSLQADGACDLSVKRFSRRRLLQTGGIATRVWTASVLLARWICRHMQIMRLISNRSCAAGRELRGCGNGRVLELGCGLGVAGIAAAMSGCHVLLTDVHSVALSSCQAAIRCNAERLQAKASERAYRDGGHVRTFREFLSASEAHASAASGAAFTMELDWNILPSLLPHERFSCIIAADVVHEDQHAPLIADAIRVSTHTCTYFLSCPSCSAAAACAPRCVSCLQRRRTQPVRHGFVSPTSSRAGPARAHCAAAASAATGCRRR